MEAPDHAAAQGYSATDACGSAPRGGLALRAACTATSRRPSRRWPNCRTRNPACLPKARTGADLADVSRVTVRQGGQRSWSSRRGAGAAAGGGDVCQTAAAVEDSNSRSRRLLSFTDLHAASAARPRPAAVLLPSGLFLPTPDESHVAGPVGGGERVARVERLRFADEHAPGAGVVVPAHRRTARPRGGWRPRSMTCCALRGRRRRPRGAADHGGQPDGRRRREAAELLPEWARRSCRIDRTAYLPSGRPIEFTRGLYRSDLYDFVAELRLEG